MSKQALLTAVGGLLLSSTLIVQSSSASFTGSTTNPGNSWAAGTVALTNNRNGTAMFAASTLTPTAPAQSKCIVVTYSGSIAANVKLYGSITGGTGLGQYLNLTVDRGTGAALDCSDFSSAGGQPGLYSGTLSAPTTGFTATATNFSTGLGSWAPTGAGQSSTYRFTWSLQDDNAAQGLSAEATFTWEAQNT